jgi:hemoglobin
MMLMRWASILAMAVAVSALGAAYASAQESGPPPPLNLYHQLGGYDAIAAVVDDVIKRLVADPKLSKFFVGLDDVHKAELRQHFVDFLCFKTGGPCYYTGRDMKTAHAGLNITEDEWNASLADFAATEDKFNIPAEVRKQIADLFAQLKPDIVTAP